jgi:hypothetical protein
MVLYLSNKRTGVVTVGIAKRREFGAEAGKPYGHNGNRADAGSLAGDGAMFCGKLNKGLVESGAIVEIGAENNLRMDINAVIGQLAQLG